MNSCCSDKALHHDDRYNRSCFCEKCVGTGAWYVNLSGATGNDNHPFCVNSALSTFSSTVALGRRGSNGFPRSGLNRPDWNGHVQGCNCEFSVVNWGGWLRGSTGVDNFSPFYYQGNHSCWSGPLRITLELEELCITRDENNVGWLRRGLEEDMWCGIHCDDFWESGNYDCSNASEVRTTAHGYPCSPCYNNSGNVFGSISGTNPFVMDCEANHLNYRSSTSWDSYINTSPSCHPGSNLSLVPYDYYGARNRLEGEWDTCDDIADNLGGKYFWITDDIGEKYHVWFRRAGTDIDPQPAGSSGPIVVEMGWTTDPCQPWLDPDKAYFDTHNGSATCRDLMCDIRHAIGSQAYDFLPPPNVLQSQGGSYTGYSEYPMLKWQLSMAMSDWDVRFCSENTGNFPEALCSLCLKANHTLRVNGNQPATVYDGNTGFDFGDAGPPEMVGGWGNCCSGPVPRLFIEVPTLKEEVITYPDGYYEGTYGGTIGVWIPGPPLIIPVGGTGASDCAPGDPLCICDDAVGGESSPGGPPIIIDHGTNDHALYEYGVSGDFDCYGCNTFTLRSVEQGANSDTSHLSLPNEVEVCPDGPCLNKIGFLLVLGTDVGYGCPDSPLATDWTAGECFFNRDIENLRRHLEQNPQLDVRIQVVKAAGDKNAEVPEWSEIFNFGGSTFNASTDFGFSKGFCPGRFSYQRGPLSTYWANGWGPIYDPFTCKCAGQGRVRCERNCWGGQCAGCGMPAGIEGITGGGSYGGVPIGITSVDNCQQIPPDDQYYGWNKDKCCHPAGIWETFPYGPCGHSRCVPYDPSFFPPGQPPVWPGQSPPATHYCQDFSCGCCCDPPLERNICGSAFPQDSARTGGPFPADCQRVTSDDIKAAWDSLTSNSTWIPERLHFWYDPMVTGHKVDIRRNQGTVNEEAVYIENQDKMVCISSGGGHGWKPAIGDCGGESPVEIVLPHNLWEDGYAYILDQVHASNTFIPIKRYIYGPPYSRPTSIGQLHIHESIGVANWVKRVYAALPSCKAMSHVDGDNTTYLADDGCPSRYSWSMTQLYPSGGGQNVGNDPNAFFDCPPNVSPCYIEILTAPTMQNPNPGVNSWMGFKKNYNYSCCNPGIGWGGTYDKDGVIRNHPINAGGRGHGLDWDFGYLEGTCSGGAHLHDAEVCYPWIFDEMACDCCPCDRPIGDATFTIPNTNTCWGINRDGQEIEAPMPLGGTFTLKPVDLGNLCSWGNEFTGGSFITEAKLVKGGEIAGWSPMDPYGRPRFSWEIYRLDLYHRDTLFASYFAQLDDPNTWPCSGSITLDKQLTYDLTSYLPQDRRNPFWQGEQHVCDPCSWEGEDNAFADFALNTLIDTDDDCEQINAGGGTEACGLACGYMCDCSDCRRRNAEYLESINNASITLTSTDGTTRTYTLKTDGSADPSNLEFNWDNQPRSVSGTSSGKCIGTLENFKGLLASSAGHDGKIVMICPPRGSTIGGSLRHFSLVQRETGEAGNTTITYNDEFKEWCELPLFNPYRYSRDASGDAVCPTKFIGGEWCEAQSPNAAPAWPVNCPTLPCPPGMGVDPPFYGGVLGAGVKCYENHPSSWPHSCPCADPIIKCLPETITVTI